MSNAKVSFGKHHFHKLLLLSISVMRVRVNPEMWLNADPPHDERPNDYDLCVQSGVLDSSMLVE
jgi:hypothetical protein